MNLREAKLGGHRWLAFMQVVAITMLLTAAVFSSLVSLMAYAKSTDCGGRMAELEADIKILQTSLADAKIHIDRLYRELELVRASDRRRQ